MPVPVHGLPIWAVEKSRAFATFLSNLNNLLLFLLRPVSVRSSEPGGHGGRATERASESQR